MDENELETQSEDLNTSSTSETTTMQLLTELKDIWRNERFAPELLPHHVDLVDCLLEQVRLMEGNVEKARGKEPYRCHVHKMELNRIRFMLSNYLRCRLEKLELFTAHYSQLSAEQQEHFLSPAELTFLNNFADKTDELLTNSVAPYLPTGMPVLDAWKKNPARPKLNSFVFVKPKEVLEGVILDAGTQEGREEEIVTLEEGGQYLLRYSSVRDHVMANRVLLM